MPTLSCDEIQKANLEELFRINRNHKKDSKDRYSLEYFESRLERVNSLWERCTATHPEVLGAKAHNSTLLKEYQDSYEQAEELSLDLITSFKKYINDYKEQKSTRIVKPTTSAGEEFQSTKIVIKDNFQLERIKIPQFDGNYMKWTTFHELFNAMVHKNDEICKVQKMQYLKSLLTDEASNLIKHLPVSEENYEAAYELLKNRFANKRVIMSSHLHAITSASSTKAENANSYKRLLDITTESLTGIKGLGQTVDSWGPIIVHILVQKLDIESRKKWEDSQGSSREFPTLSQLTTFLEERFRAIEAMGTAKLVHKTHSHSVNIEGRSCCILCNDNHRLFKCNKFQHLNVQQKRSLVEKHKLCFNCLQLGHASRSCLSKTRCLKCKAGHHTSLHMEILKPREILTATNAENGKDVLLATALIQVKNKFGDYVTFRALIDQGSQRSFITEATVQCLKLPRSYDKTIISGIGSSEKTVSRGAVNLKIKEKWTSNHQSISALIIPQITCDLPYKNISPNSTKINVDDLADPTFYIKGKIDILLGADIFSNIIKNGVKDAQSKYLTAQKTSLGWILSGPIPIEQSYKTISLISTEDVDRSLQKFWEQEEVKYHIEPSSQDLLAEEIYKRDVQRLPSGRYQVSLPFKIKPGTELQGTRPRALQRLYQLERRFKINSELKDDYNKVMNEYFHLQQIEEVPPKEIHKLNYYLPHHAVLKASSTTTKTRVVFDASATSPAGKSLNDFLLTGPTIQESLYEILMRWRKYKFAITGDIEKMYRQIWLKPEDRDFHRILWRKHPTDEVKDYRLKTVTFGVASAPFLAIRTLHEIALSIKSENSKLANIIVKDFYVDDVMTGAFTLEEAKDIRKDLSEIFIKAGFPLRKWAANHNSILSNIAEADRELQLPLDSEKDVQVKTLGLYWLPATDVFSYKVLQLKSQKENHTKRSVLSEVSKLFDPLGWLQPILIKGKSLLQQLWLTQIGWDCPLPDHIQDQWNNLRNDLYNIQKLHIPRWINYDPGDEVQLHGFSDASLIAYAAVIYIRIEKPNGNIITHLLSSKSKVAPIKTVSIPRLELCGAQLVLQLMNQVSQAFKWAKINKFFWTDSTIVLSWLSQHPNKWKTYVANRVSYILSNSTRSQWRHVQGKDNPADIASRGVSADQLRLSQLWWKGPEWLNRSKTLWPLNETTPNINLEARTTTLSAIINIPEPQWITLYSSFTKMIRITALCLRFKNNLKSKKKLISSISTTELDTAEKTCIHIVQNHFFKDEIEQLRANKEIKLSSRLKALNPFLDAKGILRVGGRLTLASVSYNQKHPIIIDGRSYLAILIIRYYHQKLLHSGTQATQTAIRLKYWIIGGLTVIKRILRNCLVCFRANPTFQNQIMGSLPEARVSPKRPFSSVGLDFGGPILIKLSSGRGAKSCKAYIALFVCLSTKAIHLQLVSDLTSDASLAAIRRFIARRGLCTDIYSDQGTNFIGANNVLKNAYSNSKKILANEKINWHFIPPGSPHFGGLWEAGIKSTKRLLKKVIGEQLLTYEEMATLLTQIKSCLNSRPLCPSSNDCNDLEAITPGHFLIGQHLYAIPETFGSQGGKWKLIQQLKNSFWERWTREYISSLQERNKWKQPKENIKLNQLVLVKDERFPSNKWPLGRIIETHPGEDGIVRVVSIKANKGIIQRNITKTCSLPNNEDDSSRRIVINKDQKSSKINIVATQTVATV